MVRSKRTAARFHHLRRNPRGRNSPPVIAIAARNLEYDNPAKTLEAGRYRSADERRPLLDEPTPAYFQRRHRLRALFWNAPLRDRAMIEQGAKIANGEVSSNSGDVVSTTVELGGRVAERTVLWAPADHQKGVFRG